MAMIEGSCLCGAVRIAVARAPETVTQCNCSACARLGTLWAYYSRQEVRIEGETRAFARGPRELEFHHCPVCGCTTHWAPVDPAVQRMGVNARLMAADVLSAARLHHFDGLNELR